MIRRNNKIITTVTRAKVL